MGVDRQRVRLLELRQIVLDVVVRHAQHVHMQHILPRVGIAEVDLLAAHNLVRRDLEQAAVRTGHEDPVSRCAGRRSLDVGDGVLARLELERGGYHQRRGIGGLLQSLAVAGADLQDLGVLRAELLGVVHDVLVLVVHEQEGVGLRLVQTLRKLVAQVAGQDALLRTGRLGLHDPSDRLVEHGSVGLGGVEIAARIHGGARGCPEEPLVVVMIYSDDSPLVREGARIPRLHGLLVLTDGHAPGDVLRKCDDHILARGSGQVQDDAASLVIERLEVIDVDALVGVVQKGETGVVKELLHLESWPEMETAQCGHESIRRGSNARLCSLLGDLLEERRKILRTNDVASNGARYGSSGSHLLALPVSL